MIRFFDIFFSLLGLVFGLPLLLLLTVIGFFDTGSPVFRQTRVGRNKKPFTLVKFRTMRLDTTSVATHLADASAVTPFGSFLRRTKLDELPQLWNVLKGEMSLVGPRPPLAEEVSQYEKSDTRRLLVTPGLTGLWQVSGRSELDWEDAVRLDLYYVENWSLTLDLLIILRTAAAVWRGEGAY